MHLTVRPITESEVDAFRTKLSRGFGVDWHEEEDSTRFLQVVDLDRTVCAFDGDELIGTCAAFPFEVTVPGHAPGNTLPMGGTTMVTVQATHRRRGVMRAMMRAHLDEVRERGEPLAGLWASESSIYGRFGYGLAAEGCEMKLDARAIRFVGDPPPGSVRLVEPADAETIFPALYERVRPTRPGMLSRSDVWWSTRILCDPKHNRHGQSAKRHAVYGDTSGPEGYAIYRQKEKWEDFPDGEVHVLELVAATPEAHEGLWRFLTGIDLFPHVKYWNLAVDDELPWRVTDPRRVQRWVADSLWLRLIDIPAALGGRVYSAAGRLVLDVRDPFMPDNEARYELEAGPDGAEARRTTAAPDLELPVDALGALYFGAHSVTTLAAAGRVGGSEEALATAARMFAWPRRPWCPEDF